MKLKFSLYSLSAMALLVFAFHVNTSTAHAQIPPKSSYIQSINWSTSVFTAAPGSDLWSTTWAADDALYVGWGDGGGMGGTNDTGRVQLGFGKITAGPTGLIENCSNTGRNMFNVNGGACTQNVSSNIAGYVNGVFAIGTRLYAWLNMEPGSPHVYRLAWSDNNAKTWTVSSWSFNPDFSPKSFIQMGKNYAGAMDNYVYMLAGPYDDPAAGYNLKDIFLVRVDKNTIADRNTYTYFNGLDGSGNPTWSTSSSTKKPIMSWEKGMGIPHATYNAGLGRFILSGAANAGNLGVFEAPKPWGPWSTVATYTNWLNLSSNAGGTPLGLTYQFVNKWTSSNGINTYMMFSCYDCNSANHDRMNVIQATFVLGSTQTTTPNPTVAPTKTPTPTTTTAPTASPTPVPTVPFKAGDANSDGKVDGLDYVIWLQNYGKTVTNGARFGDFNGNEKVDGLDYVIWLNNYGK